MRIGIDFDNTLARYDQVFTRVAREWGLVLRDELQSKQEIRRLARQQDELLWQRLQGEVYGRRMQEASLFAGAAAFLRRCAATPKVQVFVVSHKTQFGHFDATQTDLRDAARAWMQDQGFFDPEGFAISRERVFFEATQDEKVARIASLQCEVFIDDLPELFMRADFPSRTKKLLFTSEGDEMAGVMCGSWTEIEGIVFGD